MQNAFSQTSEVLTVLHSLNAAYGSDLFSDSGNVCVYLLLLLLYFIVLL